jgi:superfamily I DNA and/or RNA helicase
MSADYQQVTDILQQLQQALELEKEEERERFRQMLEEHSIFERRQKGWTWHPVNITEYGYTFGDNAFVLLERRIHEGEEDHQFRPGQPVRLFESEEDSEREIHGVIHYVKQAEMKLILYEEDYPDWIMSASVAVEQVFDERSYREMDNAISDALMAKGQFKYFLKLIYGGHSLGAYSLENIEEKSELNPSQEKAMSAVLHTRDLAVIHGPPGTGKTTTLVQAIDLLRKRGEKVLVCAPSNTAVDLLTEKLHEKKIKVLRLGNVSRVDEDLLAQTLDGKIAAHPDSKQIKDLKIEASAIRKKAGKYKRHFGPEEREERRALYKEAKEKQDWAYELERRITREVVNDAQVVCCTFVNARHSLLKHVDFDYTVIDEAGQALDPALLIPLRDAQKWVMAGDPFQLPPTVKSFEAEINGLATNMLERWITAGRTSYLLQIQYRMHSTIMGFPNAYFYNNELKADESVENWTLAIQQDQPLEFVDTAGAGFEEYYNEESKGRSNKGEANILREHFLQLTADFEESEKVFPQVAIITPYRDQVKLIKATFEEDEDLSAFLPYVSIDSIDAFQGSERPIVYLSLVRSNEDGSIGFLKDYRRMNVALTRAQKKLIVIGDSATIGGDDFYNKWLSFVEKNGWYRTAWEFMY